MWRVMVKKNLLSSVHAADASGVQLSRRSFVAAASLGIIAPAVVFSTTPASAVSSVSVKHRYGTTVVEGRPQRIVCLGYGAQDICLQLGALPVAVSVFKFNNNNSSPWFSDAVTKRGATQPKTIRVDDDENFMQSVLSAEPDLVLATNYDLLKENYNSLSRHCKVIGPLLPSQTPAWIQATRVIGKIIGQSARAERVIKRTKAKVAAYRRLYPGLDGISPSALLLGYQGIPGADFEVYQETSPAFGSLISYGLTAPAGLRSVDWDTEENTILPQLLNSETVRQIKPEFAFVIGDLPSAKSEKSDDKYEMNRITSDLGLPISRLISFPYKFHGFALVEASPMSVVWGAKFFIPRLARAVYLNK